MHSLRLVLAVLLLLSVVGNVHSHALMEGSKHNTTKLNATAWPNASSSSAIGASFLPTATQDAISSTNVSGAASDTPTLSPHVESLWTTATTSIIMGGILVLAVVVGAIVYTILRSRARHSEYDHDDMDDLRAPTHCLPKPTAYDLTYATTSRSSTLPEAALLASMLSDVDLALSSMRSEKDSALSSIRSSGIQDVALLASVRSQGDVELALSSMRSDLDNAMSSIRSDPNSLRNSAVRVGRSSGVGIAIRVPSHLDIHPDVYAQHPVLRQTISQTRQTVLDIYTHNL
ncbi:Aste57867_24591 [Aphanomyces stellatus]|uniref:Aste57867_24591 protein n=1 Tax=Aphanomyces stellatus TaxID=120398 RepID=A0A485LV50_9STRA|nr:hypothetical protein As57867_024513 [Aphanomyces stellatus]VFU01230.1 Aste57867_24591 [Aphanomyces stellatus]